MADREYARLINISKLELDACHVAFNPLGLLPAAPGILLTASYQEDPNESQPAVHRVDPNRNHTSREIRGGKNAYSVCYAAEMCRL